MTDKIITNGFILAAGLGKRMRPYTDHMPKPMVPVCGKPVIDWCLDKMAAAGVTHVTVNLFYLPEVLAAHLKARQDPVITLSWETDLLDTGGGLKNALATMKGEAFYAINGDAFWIDAPGSADALTMMRDVWDDTRMDILLLLEPVERMVLTKGVGDYRIEPDGRATRARNKDGTHMFTGLRICHPRIFDGAPDGAFPFLSLMDAAETAGRLHAVVNPGAWHHISTPEELERVSREAVIPTP